MKPKTAVGIIAHHARYARAEKLADAVNAEVITVDTDGHLGAGRNHEQCYEWLRDTGADWSVLLEDDALPVRDFRDQLDQVLAVAPTDLVSLYLGRTRPPHWQPSIARVIGGDHHFLLGTELLHHVAVAVRTPMIPALLHHIRTDTAYRRGRLPIDEAIGRFCRTADVRVSYCHPSIVNHDASLPTVIRHHLSQHRRDSGARPAHEVRQAWAFGVRPTWQPVTAAIPEPV